MFQRLFAFAVLGITLIFSQLSTVSAQVDSSFKVPNLNGNIGMEAGTYEFVDPTKQNIEILNFFKEVSAEDAAFYMNFIAERNREMAGMINLVHAAQGSIQQMSDDSWGGVGQVRFVDFAAKARDLRARREIFLNEVNSIATTVFALAPSQRSLKDTDRNIFEDLPQRRDIDFGPIINLYSENVDRLFAHANNLPFKILLADDRVVETPPNTGNALVVKFEGAIYSDDEIAAINERVYRWRNLDRDQKGIIQGVNTYILNRIQNFVQRYGKDEQFRARDDNDMEQFVGVIEDIAQAFWMKDYMRARGLPGGAVMATYTKNWFHFDRFRQGDIVNFVTTMAYSDSELDVLKNNYKEGLVTARDQKKRITASGTAEEKRQFGVLDSVFGTADMDLAVKIAEGDSSKLAYVNSFFRLATGTRAVADAYFYILVLLMTDVQNELTLRQEGQAAMAQRYRTAYIDVDDERRQKSIDDRKRLFPTRSERLERGNRGAFGGGVGAGLGSITGQAVKYAELLRDKTRDLNRAWEQELLLENAILLGNEGNDVSDDELDFLEGDN